MTTIIAGNFQQQDGAQQALAALHSAGFPAAQTTTFFVNPPGQHDRFPIGGDKDESPGTEDAKGGTAAGAAIGGATGFASALTGTSGPMVAMPLLAWRGMSIRERIALAQIAQVPIALGATLAFLSFSEIPWRLALLSSAVLCAGMLVGMRFTPLLGAYWLRRVAAVLMFAAALGVLATMRGWAA